MRLRRLVIATQSESWAVEAQRILSELLPALDLRTLPIDVPIGSVSYAAQAASRAYGAVDVTGEWCVGMVEGLEIAALDWGPGIASDLFSVEEILGYLTELAEEGRGARLRCTLALARDESELGPFESGPSIFEVACDGRVARVARGEDGFSFDSIFLVGDSPFTLAEMPESERRLAGPRGQVLAQFSEYVERNFSGDGC